MWPTLTWAFCRSHLLLQLWENMLWIVWQTARARSAQTFSVLSMVLDTAMVMFLPKTAQPGSDQVKNSLLYVASTVNCEIGHFCKVAAVWFSGKKLAGIWIPGFILCQINVKLMICTVLLFFFTRSQVCCNGKILSFWDGPLRPSLEMGVGA